MKAKELDEKSDRGEDVTAVLDLSKARRPALAPRDGGEPHDRKGIADAAHAGLRERSVSRSD